MMGAIRPFARATSAPDLSNTTTDGLPRAVRCQCPRRVGHPAFAPPDTFEADPERVHRGGDDLRAGHVGMLVAPQGEALEDRAEELSDPYFEIHADALSWVVMLAEVVAAGYLGLVGFREPRRPAGDSRRRPLAARQSAA